MTDTGWTLSPDGSCLTLWGDGPMEDWEGPGEAPWSYNVDRIQQLIVEEGITSLGAWAFWGCRLLTEVELPSTLRWIGACAFGNCVSLVRVSIPLGTVSIGAKAFTGCASLKVLWLPASLRAVDMKAFRGCVALKEIQYGGTSRQWEGLLVSQTAQGNSILLKAHVHCVDGGVPAEPGKRPLGKDNMEEIDSLLRTTLAQKGDEHFHIFAPNLSVSGSTAKPGDCTLLVFPQGQTMLIDTGAPQCKELLLETLKRLNLTSLDCLLLSHPHIDHIGNALTLARFLFEEMGGRINYYYSIGFPIGKEEALLVDYLRQKGTTLCQNLRAGDWWTIGDVILRVLAPTDKELLQGGTDDEAVNNLSLLLKIKWKDSAYLTGGDLYQGRERMLSEKLEPCLRADVMKANHHGLFTSNSRQWLNAVRPQVILAECDDVGSSTLAAKTIAQGIAYCSTGINGAVLITLDGKGRYRVLTQYESKVCAD